MKIISNLSISSTINKIILTPNYEVGQKIYAGTGDTWITFRILNNSLIKISSGSNDKLSTLNLKGMVVQIINAGDFNGFYTINIPNNENSVFLNILQTKGNQILNNYNLKKEKDLLNDDLKIMQLATAEYLLRFKQIKDRGIFNIYFLDKFDKVINQDKIIIQLKVPKYLKTINGTTSFHNSISLSVSNQVYTNLNNIFLNQQYYEGPIFTQFNQNELDDYILEKHYSDVKLIYYLPNEINEFNFINTFLYYDLRLLIIFVFFIILLILLYAYFIKDENLTTKLKIN